MPTNTLPIAEIFESVQGEGAFVGTLMTFIRFAGCTVGKPYDKLEREVLGLEVYQEKCHGFQGNPFSCDTNYRASWKLSLEHLLEHLLVVGAKRVCLTGGEPMMHDLGELVSSLIHKLRIDVHIETSGTRSFASAGLGDLAGYHPYNERLYVACSPKQGYLAEVINRANELKILVDEHSFNEADLLHQFERYFDSKKVYLQPINRLDELDQVNVNKCLELQAKHKQLRLSIQMHKVLGVR